MGGIQDMNGERLSNEEQPEHSVLVFRQSYTELDQCKRC